MYDKFGLMLRVETTTNDVSFFKLHRWVERRNGPKARPLAQEHLQPARSRQTVEGSQ